MHEEQNMRSQIKEKKNNSGTETNRTLRYLVSFLVIMGLLVVLFFWNIGVGSVEMSFSDFWSVLTPDATLYQIVWKIRLPRIIAAMLLGGALSVSGFLLQSFFSESDCGTICAWNIFRGETGGCTDDDLFVGKRHHDQFSWNGSGGICRFPACHGICSFDFFSGVEYVVSCGMRNSYRLHLFGDYRFLRDLCR